MLEGRFRQTRYPTNRRVGCDEIFTPTLITLSLPLSYRMEERHLRFIQACRQTEAKQLETPDKLQGMVGANAVYETIAKGQIHVAIFSSLGYVSSQSTRDLQPKVTAVLAAKSLGHLPMAVTLECRPSKTAIHRDRHSGDNGGQLTATSLLDRHLALNLTAINSVDRHQVRWHSNDRHELRWHSLDCHRLLDRHLALT
eukprot:54359-Eustigmatos_ZCMA.PRE.2